MTSPIDYESARIAGGIHAFDDVTKPDRAKYEMGTEPILGDETSRKKYNEKIRSILAAMAIAETDEDDEDFIAAA